MDTTVQLWLREQDADGARSDVLHRQLRAELDRLPGVEVLPGGPTQAVPGGARGLDAATISTLAVAVLGSGGLTALVASLRDWLGRGHSAPRTVRLEIGGEVLELSGAPSGEQDRLVGLFLARHETKELS